MKNFVFNASAIVVSILFFVPSFALADSWSVSGDTFYSTDGCYAKQPDGSYAGFTATSVFLFGSTYLMNPTAFGGTVGFLRSSDGTHNWWQNNTVVSGDYTTGVWGDPNFGQTPVPTFAYFADNDTCTAPGGGGTPATTISGGLDSQVGSIILTWYVLEVGSVMFFMLVLALFVYFVAGMIFRPLKRLTQ